MTTMVEAILECRDGSIRTMQVDPAWLCVRIPVPRDFSCMLNPGKFDPFEMPKVREFFCVVAQEPRVYHEH